MILWNLIYLQLVSEHAWLTFELQFWVNFFISRFLVTEYIFWGFFFRLVLILGFQAWLRLETCREYCLEQNPSNFVIFGAHLMIFRKLRLVWFLLLCIFLCIFFVLDWRIDGWGWKSKYFYQKMSEILGGNFFFFFSKTRSCSARGEDE